MIKGLDVGYMYTKDNSKNIFKSAYTCHEVALSGTHKIIVDSKTYYVGSGDEVVDVNKIDSELNKLCILTNLAMEDTTNEFFLGLGLPVSQFSKYKHILKDRVLSYSGSRVVYKGIEKAIRIRDIIVFPQGVASLYSDNLTEDVILVDVGGLTIDVALVEFRNNNPHVVRCDTWYKGTLTLFSKVIEVINLRFEMSDKPYRAEKYLREGLSLYGEKQDLSFIQPIYSEYITPIINELKLNYPSKTVPVVLVGGGASLLYSTFKRVFKNCRVHQEGQFANALGLYAVALSRFSRFNK